VVGRPLCSEIEAVRQGFGDPHCEQRRCVLRETISAFERARPRDHYHRCAAANLARWQSSSIPSSSGLQVKVLPGDWGEVTLDLTRTYGVSFAVLNMANAHVPGGAYVEGAVAQDENMFRRTDCHFSVGPPEYDVEVDRYTAAMTQLVSAQHGSVYLDVEKPRVCIRGPEDQSRQDLGYRWLAEDEVFPFYELRAAAQDLRDGSTFEISEARKRIAAQLDTLRRMGLRHAVLGALGCGAFRNPARQVAQLYKEELAVRGADFSLIAFAIFAAGYGPGNFEPFSSVFSV
jgi:hypothetical protein